MGFIEYLTTPGTISVLVELGIAHLKLVLIAIVAAIIIGMALGILAHRVAAIRAPVMNALSILLTIPSLAFFALLIPLVGIGNPPVIIALTCYALLPIARNTLAGLQSVDSAIVESARGMGMNAAQRLLRTELPIAWPVILTGIRVASQLTVGIAAVAVLVGGDGLGDEIFSQGITRLGSPGAFEALLGGTLGILVIALGLDALFQVIGRATTSKGL